VEAVTWWIVFTLVWWLLFGVGYLIHDLSARS